MADFFITEKWLRANGVKGIAWSAGQLRVLGVGWPPKQGWLRKQIGVGITTAQKEAFETIGREHRAKKES